MNICFVCIGNSCRSIMAESYARSNYPTHSFFSAGVEPTWRISELSYKTVESEGYEIKKYVPEGLDDITESIDLYIVLDKGIVLESKNVIKKPVFDPYGYDIDIYIRVFQEIKNIVDDILETI